MINASNCRRKSIKAWPLVSKPVAQDPEEVALARRCAAGDERSIRCVFEEHEARIRAFARGMLGNEQDAEEVSVATFLQFYRTANRFRGDCSLKSYLTRIALNLVRDRVRKSKPPPGFVYVIGSTDKPSPLVDRIHEAMARLEPPDREILALYYLEETDYDELMEMLGVSYDVVKTRLVRARQRLRKLLEESDGRP